MTPEQKATKEFNEIFGATSNEHPTLLGADDAMLRWLLIHEENEELLTAMTQGDIEGIADALGDLLYVVYGAGVAYGLDLEPIFNEIHRSNMTKLGEDGKPVYREDGKVIKGPNYELPQLKPIIEAQGATVEPAPASPTRSPLAVPEGQEVPCGGPCGTTLWVQHYNGDLVYLCDDCSEALPN